MTGGIGLTGIIPEEVVVITRAVVSAGIRPEEVVCTTGGVGIAGIIPEEIVVITVVL